jgi:hypothetical protein
VVAIDAAAGGINKALHLRVARGEHDVQEAEDVGLVAGHGVGHGARHGAERALVQDEIHTGARLVAEVADAQISIEEAEAFPLAGGDEVLELVEVLAMPGGEVVEAHDALIKFEQVLDEVGADEAGGPGDEPGAPGFLQLGTEAVVGGHDAG